MKAVLGILAVLVVVILIVAGLAVGKYNSLVQERNKVDQQWAQVENQLQRRADLIPNLVNTVKGYAKQESDIFTKIAEARSKLLAAPTIEAKMEANEQLSRAMRDGGLLGTGGRFLSIAEQYPQLKSDQSFLRLQDELAGTENRLAQERRIYNEVVTNYNNMRQTFPTVLIAGLMGFQDKPLFKAEAEAKTVPKVDFGK
ncbi:MAG TPA: LemA family protein [Blastocatellia bacterium]|nr:LemA family protein [Blastocatellia bacterium]